MVSENLALGLETWDITDVREAASHVRLDQEIESWPGRLRGYGGRTWGEFVGRTKTAHDPARAMIRKAPLVIPRRYAQRDRRQNRSRDIKELARCFEQDDFDRRLAQIGLGSQRGSHSGSEAGSC